MYVYVVEAALLRDLLYTAMGRIRNRSMYRNWKSPRLLPNAYSKVTDVN